MSDFSEMRKEYENRLIVALYERLRVYVDQMRVMEDYIGSLERQLSEANEALVFKGRV